MGRSLDDQLKYEGDPGAPSGRPRTHLLELTSDEFHRVMRDREPTTERFSAPDVDHMRDTGNWHTVSGDLVTPDRPPSPGITLHTIDELMAYQPWGPLETQQGDAVREALTAAAKAVLRHVPAGRYRTAALEHVLDARMQANAGISFRGRF